MELPPNTLESVLHITRQLVEKIYPEEREVFELTLGQLNHWPQRWQITSPDKWCVEDLLGETSGETFYSPGNIPENTPPWASFAVVVAAVAEHFQRLGELPKKIDIEAKYKELGTLAQLPAKVLETSGSTVVELVKSHLVSHTYPIRSTCRYVVYEGTRKYSFAKENGLEKFRNKKNKYDIYIDDLRCEMLVLGKEPTLDAGESTTFLLLKCLLRKVGNYWTHEDLFKELRLNYTKLDKVNVATKPRPLLHRELQRIRESFRSFAGKNKVDSWFNSSNLKRVAIASDLDSCLIESLP